MNILFRMEKGIAVCLFSSFFVLACVNHIPGEKAAVSNGDIPLKFTADIHEVTYTRVAGNGFEENDEVGVFALVGSSTMKEERYADNLRFFRTSEKVFESSEPIYYPDDEVTLRLISYYPYQEEGVNMGESTMSVAVETDQNLSAGYFCSDFLVASQNLQSAPKGAIALHYDHKFFKLKIALVGKEGEELHRQNLNNHWMLTQNFLFVVFILRRFMISKKKLIPLFLMRKALLLPENGRYREIG